MIEGDTGTEKDAMVRRIVARIVDITVIALISIIPLFYVEKELWTVVFALVGLIIYGTVLEGWIGQTMGKKLLRIVVVKVEGSPCGYISAFVRNLLIVVDGLFYFLVGLIIIAASEKRQRLGDHLANTVVVKKKLIKKIQT